MFCQKCGAEIDEKDMFCRQCGTPVKHSETERQGWRTQQKNALPEDTPPHRQQPEDGQLEWTPYTSSSYSGRMPENGLPERPYRRGKNIERKTDRNGSMETESTRPERSCRRSRENVGQRRKDETYSWREAEHTGSGRLYSQQRHTEASGNYRDSFMGKREEKSHAMLVTAAVLLGIAVLAAAFLVFYFVSRRMATCDPDAVVILTESAGNGNSGRTSGGTIAADQGPEKETEPAVVIKTSGQEQTSTEKNAGQATEKNAEQKTPLKDLTVVRAQTETQGQAADAGQKSSEIETETEAQQVQINADRIDKIFTQESTAKAWACYVYDLKTHKEWGTGDYEKQMYASAVITVPILYTAAVKLDAGEITLNDPITYVNSIGGRGLSNPEERDGSSFPLSYYLTTMLTYSDNNCMNCLIDYLGLDQINAVCRSAGFTSVDLQRKIVAEVTDGKDNYISARDLVSMVKELYNGKFQTLGTDFMKQYFKIDDGDGSRTVIGLADVIPADSLFLNQNGRGDTRYNEVALIADGTREYIISIMCTGDYGFQYETAVQDISSYVYQMGE